MDFNQIYQTIVSEPLYLSLVIIFMLIIVYSVLKKFFKILIVALTVLVVYISFLIYTGGDLPGESEEIINPIINQAGEIIKDVSNQLKNLSNEIKD